MYACACCGATEVTGTARTFLPKRAIHGTTEEARLNSVREFLCDRNSCKRILHKAISSSAMLELDLLRGQEDAEDAAASQSPFGDVSAHGLIRSLGFVNEHHQHVLDMLPSCFYLSWGDTRETRNILSIQTSTHDLDL